MKESLKNPIRSAEPHETVKPETTGNTKSWGNWWYICGRCKSDIDYQDGYCRHCGSKLDWSDALPY